MYKIFKPFVWISDFIQNRFKTVLFLLLIYILFFATASDVVQKPNLYKLYLNSQILEAESFLKEVENASKEHIKGVLLLVDSPGGAVAPSVEISMAIKELSSKKPVVAYATGTMASGSYYGSIWSDVIIANPGSTIGSIGVKFEGYDVSKLAKMAGIGFQNAQAGEYKNAGTFKREWTKEEKEQIESLITDVYDMFVLDVATARGLDINSSSDFAEGKVFSAQKAKELGLVDKLGSYNGAVEYLAGKTGVAEARFNEPDKIDQMIDRFVEQSSKALISLSAKPMALF